MTRPQTARHLNGYYYGFTSTGNDAVDAILEAVAIAGHGSHHTDGWNDNDGDGPSYAERIQHAANEAARKWGAEL